MTDSRQPAATLTMTRGPGAGRRFDIGAAPVTIGRDAQCDVLVEGTWVSRQHVRIAWTGTEYIVEDLDSTNGTFVNGERVGGPRALKSGDFLQLGEQVELAFQVRVSAPVHAQPVPPGMAPSPRSSAGPPQLYAPPSEPVPAQKESFLRRKSTRVWGLALLGLLIVLLVGGGVYYLLTDKGQPEAGTPTAQAALPGPTTASPTPTPTATPMPVLSTATPMPTATPTPMNTPTPILPTNTPTPVLPTNTPTFSHIISLGPGRFGGPLWLEVIKGDYRLVSGATLRPGSAIDVYEDWLTFPAGLAINVEEAEVTLKGTTYPPGTQLVVNNQGDLEQR